MSRTTRAQRRTGRRISTRLAILSLVVVPLAPFAVVALVVATLAALSRSGARTRVAAEDVAVPALEIDRTPSARTAGRGVFGTLQAAPGLILAGAAAVVSALRGRRVLARLLLLSIVVVPFAPIALIAVLVAAVAAPLLRRVRSGLRPRILAGDLELDATRVAASPVALPPVTAPAVAISAEPRPAGLGFLGTLRAAPGKMLAGTAAVGVAVVLAASGAAGSYAYYNTQTAVGTYTISSGSLAINVKYGTAAAGSTAAIPATSFQNLQPGDAVGVPLTFASTGTAAATVTAKLAAAAPAGWEVRIAPGACTAGQLGTAALTTSAIAYGTFPAGVSTAACVQVVLRSDAAATVGSLSGFDIVIDATQVQS